MADKATTYVPMTGVDMLHYAVVTTDTSTEYAAEDPVPVPGATEVGFNVNAQTGTFYADNVPYATDTALGEIDVAVACADVPPSMRAAIYGYLYDATTGELKEGELKSVAVALMYRIRKSNGAYRYVTIYNAKAAPNEERVQTKGGSINFQTNGFSMKAATRAKDKMIRSILDDDDPKLPTGVTPETIAAKYFTAVGATLTAS